MELGEREARRLERETVHPADRGRLEARFVLRLHQLEDRERLGQRDVGQLGGDATHAYEVSSAQRRLEPFEGRSMFVIERMFALRPAARRTGVAESGERWAWLRV
jgi:hypothetical protein